ncbi:protease modulator HflC [Verrucomicrobia bacterium]|nr:protease modulator HflC [Verrucomicrobiota bacterium]
MNKKNPLTLVTAGILAVIFLFLLLTFQVRKTDIAIITQLGKHHKTISEPGFNFRLPWPLQKIYKFDNRTRTMDKKFEQTNTKDEFGILATIYIGWKIKDPKVYLERFEGGDDVKAESALEGLMRDAKNSVLGQHPLSALVAADEKVLKFDQIEQEMLAMVKSAATDEYGIEIVMLGIKQLGLPETTTQAVFSRMIQERQSLVTKIQSEGNRRASEIRAEADRQRQEIVAKAQAEARLIEGKADAEAAKSYKVFEENPELAILILRLNALEEALSERTTLILDQGAEPLNLLQNSGSSK